MTTAAQISRDLGIPLIADNRTKLTDLTVGGDPEGFIFNPEAPINKNTGFQTHILPAALLLDGHSKDHPLELAPGINIHYDNITLEHDIIPSSNYKQFMANLGATQRVIKQWVESYVPQGNLAYNTGVSIDEISNEDHSSLYEFGCSPSLNAWTLSEEENPALIDWMVDTCRLAGGHIHLGFREKFSDEEKFALVRTLDLVVGLKWMKTKKIYVAERARVYGRPGACRLKDYGIEYRVPGSTIWAPRGTFWPWFWDKALPFVVANPFFCDQLIVEMPVLANIIPTSLLKKETQLFIQNKLLPIGVI